MDFLTITYNCYTKQRKSKKMNKINQDILAFLNSYTQEALFTLSSHHLHQQQLFFLSSSHGYNHFCHSFYLVHHLYSHHYFLLMLSRNIKYIYQFSYHGILSGSHLHLHFPTPKHQLYF